jgi:hypothetical protein
MLNELELPSLQDWRKQQRLIFFYKVVEGHIYRQFQQIPILNSNETNVTASLKHLTTSKVAISSASDQGIIQDPWKSPTIELNSTDTPSLSVRRQTGTTSATK